MRLWIRMVRISSLIFGPSVFRQGSSFHFNFFNIPSEQLRYVLFSNFLKPFLTVTFTMQTGRLTYFHDLRHVEYMYYQYLRHCSNFVTVFFTTLSVDDVVAHRWKDIHHLTFSSKSKRFPRHSSMPLFCYVGSPTITATTYTVSYAAHVCLILERYWHKKNKFQNSICRPCVSKQIICV